VNAAVLRDTESTLLGASRPCPALPGWSARGFVGPGMRRSLDLRYVPSRLSLLPRLFQSVLAPDVVLLHTSLPHHGTVSLGTEVNVLPPRWRRYAAAAGSSSPT
jgi:hypothetical protein